MAMAKISNLYAHIANQKMSRPGPSCSKRRKLNELVKGHFFNCFSRFNIQYSDIFC